MSNKGSFRSHLGYLLRRTAEGLLVQYMRTHANPHLPRSFRWLPANALEDLCRYISGIVRANDAGFVQLCEQNGFVTDIAFEAALDSPNKKSFCRPNIRWLADVAHGREPLHIPNNMPLTIRTNRQGYSVAECAQQLIDADIVHHSEMSAKPLFVSTKRRVVSPMQITEPINWAAGVEQPLRLLNGDLLWQGYYVRTDKIPWRANALIPHRSGYPESFRWHQPNNLEGLADLLTAIHQRSEVSITGIFEQQGRVSHLAYPTDALEPTVITVSPLRLKAILRGEDPLPMIGDDLLASRLHGGRWFPYRCDPRLLDRRLDNLHARAVRARTQWALELTCPRPVLNFTKSTKQQQATALDFAEHWSGSNLLAYGYVMAERHHHAWERGTLADAIEILPPTHEYCDDYELQTTWLFWPGYGKGVIRCATQDGQPFWLGWQPFDATQWHELAKDAGKIAVLSAVTDRDIVAEISIP